MEYFFFQIIRIKETREGFLDLNDLERKLEAERAENSTVRMVGYFSAASCITGVLADDVATTLLLRQYGALSIWDYTSGGEFFMKKNYNFTLKKVYPSRPPFHNIKRIFQTKSFLGSEHNTSFIQVSRRGNLRAAKKNE